MKKITESWKAIVAGVGAAVVPFLPVIEEQLQTWAQMLVSGLIVGAATWLKKNSSPA